MNSLGWSRRADDEPVNTSQQSGLLSSIQSLNPFGDRGYVRLPITEGAGAPLPAPSRREEEEGWFTCESLVVFPTPHADHASCEQFAACGVMSQEWTSKSRVSLVYMKIFTRGRKADSNIVSRWDRLLVFGACNLGVLVCFVICFALFPVLSLRPTKFVTL